MRGFRLEKDLQEACVRWARSEGWLARRYSAPGRRSSPDYFFAKHGQCVWIEFKLPGKKPTELQEIEIRTMRAAGLTVYWIDNIDDFRACLLQ
jgi:hypothetical protein